MRTTIGIKMSLLAKKVGLSRQKNGEIHVSILTIPTIWTKFNKWLRDWQGTAMIGLGSNKNMPSWYISCHFVHNIVQITESFFLPMFSINFLTISLFDLTRTCPKSNITKVQTKYSISVFFINRSLPCRWNQKKDNATADQIEILFLLHWASRVKIWKNYFLSKNPNNSWWNKHFHSGQVHTHQRTILAGQSSLKGLF